MADSKRRRRPKSLPAADLESGKPVRRRDIVLFSTEGDDGDRDDGPPPRDPKRPGGGKKKAKGKRVKASQRQQLILAACVDTLWRLAGELQAPIDEYDDGRRGRNRTWHAADALVYCAAVEIFGSATQADAELWPDPDVAPCVPLWNELVDAVAKAWRDHPARRLSLQPFDRHKHRRAREGFIDDEFLDRLRVTLRHESLMAAADIGALNPRCGSRTHPDPSQIVSADGSWLRAIYNNTDPHAFDGTTGHPLRIDPDAVQFRYNDGSIAPAPGHLLVALLARTPYVQERIILDHYIKNPHLGPKSDATIAVDLVLGLYNSYKDKLKDALRGLAYDMALRSEDHDRLLDAGLLGISQTPKKSKKRLASAFLGAHTFTKTDGTTTRVSITAINGIPTIAWIDGDGETWFVPLNRTQTKHSKHSAETVIYNICSIPENQLLATEPPQRDNPHPPKQHPRRTPTQTPQTPNTRTQSNPPKRPRLRTPLRTPPGLRIREPHPQTAHARQAMQNRHTHPRRLRHVRLPPLPPRRRTLRIPQTHRSKAQHLVRQTLRTRLASTPPQQTGRPPHRTEPTRDHP